jgi:type I restriction enzyme S subunit
MSNNKLIPELRFPEFENEGEWVETSVEENCLVKGRIGYRGYTTEDIVEHGKGALVLGGKHIQNQLLRLADPTFLSWEKYYESPEIMVEVGDIIFSQRGTLGDCAIIDKEIGPATINPSMVLLKNITCDARFLYYILIGDGIQNEVRKNRAMGAIPMISQKQIREFPFLIPESNEQQCIASCLSSLDEVIAAHSQKLNLLKDHKKGMMQNLFPQEGEKVPKRRFKEFEKDGDWVEKKMGEVCKMQAGKFVSASEIKIEFAEDLFPCYGGNGLRGYTKSFTHTGTYSLIGRQGALCGNITLAEGNFHATEHAVVVKPEVNVDTIWLYYVLELMNLNQYATGQAQPGLSVSNLEQLELSLPKNSKEQQKIASCLSSLNALITAQVEKIEQLKLHKKGLMQGLFPKIND